MLQIFSTQPQATIVLVIFLIILLLVSSFPLPQLVIQFIPDCDTYHSLSFFHFSPQRKMGWARPHHLLLLLRICIKQIRVLLYVSRLTNIIMNSILKVVILKVLIYSAVQCFVESCKVSQLLEAVTPFPDTNSLTYWKWGSDDLEEIPYKTNFPPLFLDTLQTHIWPEI